MLRLIPILRAVVATFAVLLCARGIAEDAKVSRRLAGNVVGAGKELFAVTAEKGAIIALTASGEIRWTCDGVSGSRSLNKRQLLVAPNKREIYAIGTGIAAIGFDGTERWKYRDFEPGGPGAAIDESSGLFYAIKSDMSLCAITMDGKLAWRIDSGFDSTVPLCVFGGNVVAVDIFGRLQGFSANGKQTFLQGFPERVTAMTVSKDGQHLHCVCADGPWSRVDGKGELVSSVQAPIRGVEFLSVQNDGSLVAAAFDTLVGVKPGGEIDWRHKVDGSAIAHLQQLENGSLFVTTEAGGWALYRTNGECVRKGVINDQLVSTSAVLRDSGRVLFGTEQGHWVER